MAQINKIDAQENALLISLVKFFNNSMVMGPLIGLVVFTFFAIFMHFQLFDNFEMNTLEWRFRHFHGSEKASDSCVVLTIDDESVKGLGHWPWTRSVYVDLIEALEFYGVKTIAFDLFFPHPFQEKSDQDFIDKIKTAPNVIIGMHIVSKYRDKVSEPLKTISNQLQHFALQTNSSLQAVSASDLFVNNLDQKLVKEKSIVFYPLKPFRNLFKVVKHFGLVNITSEISKNITVPLFIDFDGFYYPSLPLSSYLVTIGDNSILKVKDTLVLADGKKIPVIKKNQYVINWYSASQYGYPYVSYPVYYVINAYRGLKRISKQYGIPINEIQDSIDYYYTHDCSALGSKCDLEKVAYKKLIDDENDYEFLRRDFKDKYIFVGVTDTSAGSKDIVKTPLISEMPGVYMHANILDNILQEDFIKKISTRDNLIVMLILCILTCVTLLRIRNPVFGVGLVMLYCLYFIVPLILFDKFNIWLDLFYTESAIIVSFAAALAYQYKVADKGKHEMRKLFSNYISPQILNEVTKEVNSIKLGGKRKEISILFSDIRGFTSISEQSTPEEVVAFLNEYFDEMVEAILKTDGTIDKFIGDAIMAFWGAPVEYENHAELCIKGALNMVNALDTLKYRWKEEGKVYPEINIGVGINTGEAIVGHVGSSRIKSYTVIGDSVNLASRLEGVNKNYPPQTPEEKNIIISENTYCKVKDKFDVQYLGEEKVKGKLQPVKIYRVLGIKKENTNVL